MKIVITDSGLGGISVCSEIEKLATKRKKFSKLELIFFNSLPGNGLGYNSMKSKSQKAEVFNSALESMQEKFNPDRILIACNTLTSVYPLTEFSHKTVTPVVGVINFGVNLALEEFKNNSNSFVLILGTPTTVNSLFYQQQLLQRGVDEKRLLGQSCFMLESEIQLNPFSPKVKRLIEKYLSEAKEKISNEYGQLIVIFGCTHYTFSKKIFEEALSEKFSIPFHIVNPNNAMAESVFVGKGKNIDSPEVSVKLISQADINDDEKSGIGNLIKEESPKTYSALLNPVINKNLFQYKLS